MNALKKTTVGLLLALLLAMASPVLARTSSSHYHSRSSRSVAGKSVHVRSYTKKNGTHVKAYNRRPPHSR